jgi:hypothetical protein
LDNFIFMPRCPLCRQRKTPTTTKQVGDQHVNKTLFPFQESYEYYYHEYRISYNGNSFSPHICDDCVSRLYQIADKPVIGNQFTFSEADKKAQEVIDQREAEIRNAKFGLYLQIGMLVLFVLSLLYAVRGTILFWILLVLVILGIILFSAFYVMMGRAMGRALR